jgi:glycosyltransferase involved in cell wall biosynthesis
VIPNGIDVAECDARGTAVSRDALRTRICANADDIVLLSVGRIEANKGFHVLADALASLGRDARPWRWVLIGDGPPRARVQQRIAAAGLSNRVTFAGRLPDEELHAWYRAADLFVHPTLYEGSSLVTLEAMTHRVPIVATAAGGLPDKVRPGHNGWLVPPGSADALKAALEEALSSSDAELAGMGLASRAIAEAEFSWTVIAGQLRSLFATLARASRV